ncbi:MAG: hemerythrin domain-containing protein [Gammaproteobacteria bacterium]|nr:MAG: hemerythrin domain-containing protein [Gammaproteobacteria bacterium]
MSKDLKRVLQELRQDHHNIALLLGLLERESGRIHDGVEPDYELLHDIMRYMTVYPDTVHHPKEDRVYAELKTVRPDLSSGLARITVDHRNIVESGLRLRDEFASIDSGNMVRRNTIVDKAQNYVNTLRSHMQWEELDLFRRIDEMIAAGHTRFDAANYSSAADPVFGPEVERQFGRLARTIHQ